MIDALVWCYSTLIKCDVGVIVTELCTTTWSMFSDWWILVDVLWFYIMLDVFFLMCFRLCVLFDVLCRLMYYDYVCMVSWCMYGFHWLIFYTIDIWLIYGQVIMNWCSKDPHPYGLCKCDGRCMTSIGWCY